MHVEVSSLLERSAGETWGLVKKTSTMLHVCRGLLGVAGADELPEIWHEGAIVRRRLLLFHFLPLWLHEIRITCLDDQSRVLQTTEQGGLLQTWDHTISVEPAVEGRSRYTDAVELRAGLLTPVVWLSAQVFFRYRQLRLRRLVRSPKHAGERKHS